MGRARRPAVHLGKCLDIFIWDVGHGSAAAARLLHGTVIMLDCGPGSAGFSPVRATLGLWKKIDGLIISHPHMDHMGDISSMPPDDLRLLVAPRVPCSQLLDGVRGSDMGAVESYMRLRSRLRFPFADWGMFRDTHVRWFGLGGHRNSVNEYSIVTFIRHGWFTLLHAGDLPAARWADMLEAHGTQLGRLLLQTNFFVIPHHGRRDAYSPGLLGLLANLQMGVISDGREGPQASRQGTTATLTGGPH